MSDRLRPLGWTTPHDVLDWGVALGRILESGESISSVAWTVDAIDAARGVIATDLPTGSDPDLGPIAWARVEIAPGQRDHERWSWPGCTVRPAVVVESNRDRRWRIPVAIRICRVVPPVLLGAARVLIAGDEP